METPNKLVKIGLISLYFIIVISTEPTYRNVLFDKSIPIAKSWNPSDSMLLLYKFLSDIGKATHMLTLFIFHVFFPLSKSYALLSVYCYSTYLTGLFKMIYGNIRPFWVDNSLGGDCETSWGNPSGHALFAAAFYLALWDLLTDIKYFHNNRIARYLCGLFAVLFVIFNMISRVVLGAHSINQVIYGGLLGLGVYLAVFHVAGVNKLKGPIFFDMFRDKKNIIIHLSIYLGMLLLAVVIYQTVDYDTREYQSMLKRICPNTSEANSFSNHSMGNTLFILTQLGAYLSLVFLTIFISREYRAKEDLFEDWNCDGDMWMQLFRVILCLSMVFPMGFYLAISKQSNLIVIYVFKNGFSFFFTGLSLYGLSIYLSVKTRICNPKILYEPNELRKVEIV
jgi:membrane-associated phospholipid phosphatase